MSLDPAPGPAPARGAVSPLWLAWASANAALAVALGAVASHAGGAVVDPTLLRLAADYQMSHALGTAALAAALPHLSVRPARLGVRLALWLMALGLVLFCGSLVGLGFGHPLPRSLGVLTPLGGTCLILAWLSAAIGCLVGVRREQ